MGNLPLQRDWIWDWFASPIPLWITYIATVFAFIFHPILFGLHIHRKIINSKSKDTNPTSPRIPSSRSSSRLKTAKNLFNHQTDNDKVTLIRNITTITTLISLLFGWIASIITFVNASSTISSSSTCEPISILQNICWVITKLTIYQVLILRLQAAFWGSMHEYNRKLMFSAYIFVSTISLICIIGSIIEDKTIGVTSIHFKEGWCLLIVPTWLILLPCVLDVICSVFATYLFLRVLKKLLARNEENIAKNKQLLSVTILMSKLLLLTIIAILSNLFGGIWFAVTDIALFTYLDTIINPICLVLMEAQHKDIYRFCCKYCHIATHRIVHRKRPTVASKPFTDRTHTVWERAETTTVWEKTETTMTESRVLSITDMDSK
eukprot:96974_1